MSSGLVGPNGLPIGEGPTGRVFSIVERIEGGQKKYSVDLKGEFETVETLQMLAKICDFVASRHLVYLASERAKHEVAAQMQNLAMENKV